MVTQLPSLADMALLTTSQLANILQCHRNSILSWTKRGLIAPKYHSRGRKMFVWKDVKAFFYRFF